MEIYRTLLIYDHDVDIILMTDHIFIMGQWARHNIHDSYHTVKNLYELPHAHTDCKTETFDIRGNFRHSDQLTLPY